MASFLRFTLQSCSTRSSSILIFYVGQNEQLCGLLELMVSYFERLLQVFLHLNYDLDSLFIEVVC